VTARIGNIAFDCDDALKVATFWSAVLGRPVDKGGSKGFASIGGADPDRRAPAWYFEKVPEGKRCGPATGLACSTSHMSKALTSGHAG
jgi:hypothetical protein